MERSGIAASRALCYAIFMVWSSIRWKRTKPTRRCIKPSEFPVSYGLALPYFPRYDYNVIRIKKFYSEYLKSHIINYFNCEAGIENMLVEASVIYILF